MFTETVSYPAALAAGLLSFFSPCILPLVPAYFSFITGYSIEDLTTSARPDLRRRVVLATAAFVAGFSVIFVLLGASASLLGGLIYEHRATLRIVGGLLIILLGVHMTGMVRFRVLEYEKRLHLRRKPLHFLGTFLVGMAFAAGWSPCIGPLLGSILIVAGSQDTVASGTLLLGIYAAGMALPFIAISVSVHYLLLVIKRLTRALRLFNIVAGSLLILVGIALLTNSLMRLAAFS